MADYRVELPNAEPLMVRANNRAAAIRFTTHRLVKCEILTTEEAIRLGAKGQQLLDASHEPGEPDTGTPLLDEPERDEDGIDSGADAELKVTIPGGDEADEEVERQTETAKLAGAARGKKSTQGEGE